MIPREALRRGMAAEIAGYVEDELGASFEGIRIRRFRRGPDFPLVTSISRHFHVLAWLALASHGIDCLTIVHSSKASLRAARIYRRLNSRGRLYFKADLSNHYLDAISASARSWSVFASLVKASTITGIETSAMLEACRARFSARPDIAGKLKLVPNGFSPEPPPSCSDNRGKEKMILYVGYIGTEAKRSELLLEAFERILPSPWRLVMVGPIAPGFQPAIEAFQKRHPGALAVPGPILDREELFGYYGRAAIFCLTSRWESFCYSLLEAAYFNDYLVSTDVGVAADLLAAGAPGTLAGAAPEEYAQALAKGIAQLERQDLAEIDNSKVRERFSWRAVLDPVFTRQGTSCE